MFTGDSIEIKSEINGVPVKLFIFVRPDGDFTFDLNIGGVNVEPNCNCDQYAEQFEILRKELQQQHDSQ